MRGRSRDTGPVASDAFLPGWCDRYLGARPARVLFRSGHLSQVVGVELADGRRVVIKARPAGRRIAGCVAVQRHLACAGFPCPEPLTDPVQARGLTVTAEVLVPGGSQLPAEGGAAPFAALLARLVSPHRSRLPFLRSRRLRRGPAGITRDHGCGLTTCRSVSRINASRPTRIWELDSINEASFA